MKTIRLTFALAVCLVALQLHATYPNQHSILLFNSPASAAYAVTHSGLDGLQMSHASIFPVRTMYDGGYPTPDRVTYGLFYPASIYVGQDVLFDANSVPDPPTSAPSGAYCVETLGAWTVLTFTTHADAVAFFDGTAVLPYGHLDDLQRNRAALYSPPQSGASEQQIVVFQQRQFSCSIP